MAPSRTVFITEFFIVIKMAVTSAGSSAPGISLYGPSCASQDTSHKGSNLTSPERRSVKRAIENNRVRLQRIPSFFKCSAAWMRFPGGNNLDQYHFRAVYFVVKETNYFDGLCSQYPRYRTTSGHPLRWKHVRERFQYLLSPKLTARFVHSFA